MSLFSKLRIGNARSDKREKTGLWELSNKDAAAEGCVDIIAIHGLGGDAYGTWTHENGKLWLRDFLPSQIPEARIFTYGYASMVAFSKSSAEVDDFARDLLQRLKVVRKSTEEQARPLFFICHSLGGILLKQTLSIAHKYPNDYGEILHRFAGVAFMGTPHGGADLAVWMTYASQLLNAASLGTRTNKGLVQILRKDSTFLGALSKRFAVQNGSRPILSFYETEKFPLMNCRIVEKESTHLRLENEILLPIRADHRTMCRFADLDSQKYLVVWEAIATMVRSAAKRQPDDSTTSIVFAQYRTVLNEWLNPVPAIDDLERIKTRRLENSCLWIEENAIFQNWLDLNRSSVLILEGPPGCGKSTITTRIIELLQTEHPVAYFFCDAKDVKRQAWSDIIRTWTWQLLLQKRYAVDDIFNIYAETSGATTPLASYYKALKCLLQTGKKAFLILDGLDESEDLESHMSRQVIEEITGHAKLLCVSRPGISVDYVAGRISGSFGKVIIRPLSNATDIARLIKQGVESLDLDETVSKKIVDRLIQGANGMFLWAYLMLRHISQLTTLAALEDLPEGLEDLYTHIIRRIGSRPPNQSNIACNVLQWTFSAVRPLTIAELSIALAVEPGSCHYNENNTIHNLAAAIRNCCSPLLEVDETRGVVRFVHSSAVEFLKQARSRSDLSFGSETLPIIPETRNEYNASVCLTYLSYDNIDYVPDDEDARAYDQNLKSHLEANCFLEYCALNWWKHLPLMESSRGNSKEQLLTSVHRFVSSEKAIVKWLQMFQLLDGPRLGKIHKAESFCPGADQYSWISETPGSRFSQLWLAPSGLFTRWDRWVTESFFNGRHSTPIGIAAFFDFTNAVKSELAKGVSVNVRDSVGFTPLLYSAHGDAVETLRRLLDRGADIEAKSLGGFGSVRYASRNCTTVLPLLLKRGASISSQEQGEGLTALHAACISVGWHPMVLRELLRRSTSDDLMALDYLARTPLHLAATIDLKTSVDLIVGRLLQEGKSRPQIHAISAQEAFTPILSDSIRAWAVAWGSPLARPARVTAFPERLHSEVTSLVQKIKATMLSMLRRKNPRVDSWDASGQMPVHLAAATSLVGQLPKDADFDSDPVIQSLLNMGSKVECQNVSGQKPLDIAVARGSWITALTLLRAEEGAGALLESSLCSIKAIIQQNARDAAKSRSQNCMFAGMERRYYPKSLLDILEVSHILRARLSVTAPLGALPNNGSAYIVSSILDFAEYWAISTNDVSVNAGELRGNPPSAKILLGEGQVRRLEIYVVRPAMMRGSHHDPRHQEPPTFSLADTRLEMNTSYGWRESYYSFGSFMSSHSCVPQEYYHSRQNRRTISRDGNLFHKHGALLQLVRHRPSMPPASKSVSTVPGLWKHANLQGMPSSDETWKQDWPLPLSSRSPDLVTISEARQVMSWIKLLRKGDTITLSVSEEFFVQDIALYSKFGLVIYTALV